LTEYVKSTNFASKDSLAIGNPLKIVKGTEIDGEFNNIATAVATKADLNSPALIGTPTAPTASLGTSSTQLATTAFVLQHLYPVGSIYINAGVTTNPSTLFGFGTWTAFGAGRVMVGLNGSDALFDALEETGGSKDATLVSHNHTGTTDGGGAHTHSYVRAFTGNNNTMWHTDVNNAVATGQDNFTGGTVGAIEAVGNHSHGFTTSTQGSSATDANLQPYITVAMWKRTA
jgi:hypothetical protein